MPDPIFVDDAADPRLVDFMHLRDPARRVRMEADGGFFVGEGELVVRRMLTSHVTVRSVLVTPRRHAALADALASLAAPVYVADEAVLRATVGFDLHRGAVAAADRPTPRSAAALVHAPGAQRVLAIERLNDHENLGGVFRSAAALGIDAVLLCPECCDPLYRRCVRVSMGHVLTVPWAVTDPWPGALEMLRGAGFTVAALAPAGETTLTELAAQRPSGADDRIAILVGAEGPGLSASTLAAADVRVRIPMHGEVDSLNVSVAAAIAAYALTPVSRGGGTRG